MAQSFQLFKLFGFQVRMEWSALVGWVAVIAISSNVYMFIYRTKADEALWFGVLFWLIYMMGLLVHFGGHMLTSRLVGYPMNGLEFWWMFGRSLYPADEPPLQPYQHVWRAIGGPLGSVAWIVGIVLFYDRYMPTDVFNAFLLQFSLIVAVLYFLGTLWPMSFNDGGIIVEQLKRSRRQSSGA
ncbi:MAG: hypothetical protein CUN55_00895 [Phototrophicales bacterium]|nr:MAG: hypothetical protein CUN55_00895 [Phototrophicales bacterium]